MGDLFQNLIIAPVLIPLVAGALSMFLGSQRNTLKASIGLVSISCLIVIGILLVAIADRSVGVEAQVNTGQAYLLGDWPARFGIVLVLDRLSAMMVLLTAILGFAALIYSFGGWYKVGPNFFALFQFQLMGLNGAFLTGDLFNLFVFFEVLLAASYGLVLHGSGPARVKAGLHYIAINLAASSLFLVGVSLIYSVTGSLNIADLASKVGQIKPDDRGLFEAGAAILGIAFLVKAAMWPLGFWLHKAYSAACPPVAAMFAIMTKVGVYVVLRLWLLMFGAEAAGASAHFGGSWLLYGGLFTLFCGIASMLASQDLKRLATASILISSGTLLAAIGLEDARIIGGALFYLLTSTLSISAFFLLIELVERGREAGADVFAVTMEAFNETTTTGVFDDDVGVVTPRVFAALGIIFIACALLITGLPPLSGFVAKFAMLTAVIGVGANISPASWIFTALLVLSGLSGLIAMTRAGMRSFWVSAERQIPNVRMVEIVPVAFLLILCVVMTVSAGPLMRYMNYTASFLHQPEAYISDVLGASAAKGRDIMGRGQ